MNKSPRDWLLARHVSALPRLDAARNSVLPVTGLENTNLWSGLFFHHRRAWGVLASAWIIILTFHFWQKTSLSRGNGTLAVSPAEATVWVAQLKTRETILQGYFPR